MKTKKDLEIYAKNLWVSKTDFELILQKNLWISKTELFLLENIEEKYIENIKKDLERRNAWEPLEYIIEKAEFFSLPFFVDKRVLIPRNDTEIMIEKALKIDNLEDFLLIDVWTWSSAIPISIIKNSKIKNALAIDISKKALEVAKINIKKHNLWDKIKVLESNLLEKLLENNSLFFDERAGVRYKNIIITANLPYIKNKDFENMSKETLKYEPNLALFWWEKTGFELYEKLIWQIFEIFNYSRNCHPELVSASHNLDSKWPEGIPLGTSSKWQTKIILFIEIWFDQKEIAENYLKSKNLKFQIFKDNSKIERCIKICFDF